MEKAKSAAPFGRGITVPINGLGSNTRILCEPPVHIGSPIAMKRGTIGAYTYMRSGGRIGPTTKSIGRYCSIAPGVVIGDSNHRMDWLSTHPFQWGKGNVFTEWSAKKDFQFIKMRHETAGVHIGNDVWIGANAMIMPGVTVGDGAVIGAMAVVTKDVPPYAVVAGVPARVMRYRFTGNIIERLLSIKWWRFDADSLLGVPFDDVERALDDIQRLETEGKLEEIQRPPVLVSKVSAKQKPAAMDFS